MPNMSRLRFPPMPIRVEPIGPSALQRELRGALASADRVRRIGCRQSQRMRDVKRGQSHAARTLELLINELIAGGTPDEDVLALVGCIEHDCRMKLSVRRGDAVPGYADAHRAEMAAEGEANVAQVRALAERTPSALTALKHALCRHAQTIRDVLLATDAEMARVEKAGPSKVWR